MKENFIVEATPKEEDRVIDLTALIWSEHSLPNKVIQSIHEQQEDIFVQVGEKVYLDEFMIDEQNVMLEFHETSEVSFLVINECNENLAIISNEDNLQDVQTTEDQTIHDVISDSSSYFSCFEMFFETESFSSTCSEFFKDQEHTIFSEKRSTSQEMDTLFLQQEENLHVFHDPMENLCSQ